MYFDVNMMTLIIKKIMKQKTNAIIVNFAFDRRPN